MKEGDSCCSLPSATSKRTLPMRLISQLSNRSSRSESPDSPEAAQLLDVRNAAVVISSGRRLSFTAPSSPSSSRKAHTPQRHYMSQLQHLIHWRDLWGNGEHSESLHRSESMVSLACFRTLSGLASDDNVSGLQAYLQSNKNANVDERDENGTTALMVACEAGRSGVARLLLGAGADPGAADLDGWTPLALCARGAHLSLARELLDAGAPVDPRDMGGWTPLMWASYKGHEELVALLLERGADVHAHGNYHINSLVWAAGRRHPGVVRRLLAAGARPNSCDKYATSALTWASRSGDVASVSALLSAGADPNTSGMYCWTPLLQATQGNHYEIVQMLLEHKPNVNALDKDGYTALAVACKEGYYDIAVALINAGAYINVQDHSKDTCLIHAVKGGHKAIVEALLKKYVDVDLPGKEKKTAVYTAVEKGHLAILKQLLQANPELEATTISGDTPLLRAVRSRNAEMVQLLLDRKARVGAADRRGDTALHIAMRARSKQIVEILLRNPKNSQLLYKPNKSNETPYNIDMSFPKTILGQIFGARRLNTNEDNENMLGYELYSAALADMLSEPSLSVPITVGLYARWGSGKSFLLNKLREEMKNFARQWTESGWTWSWAVCWAAWHASLVTGALVAAGGGSPLVALAVTATLLAAIYLALYVLWYVSNRWEWYWPYAVMCTLARRFNSLLLLLQVVFCHPPGPQCSQAAMAQPIRFHFTDQPKSSTQEGEASVVQMLASLSEALENQYGRVCTRLFRAFRPKPAGSTADWRWRRVCCVPHIIAFELCFACVLFGVCVLVLYLTEIEGSDPSRHKILEGLLMGIGALVCVGMLANLYTWGRIIMSLLLSPRAQLTRALKRHGDGFLHALRPELLLLTDMVACLDAFTGQQTRLVVVVDALDSCEQERVLLVLNAIHALCSDPHSPFILILAIDPHIISKAVEASSRRAFSESNIGGWDYLRNMVQLPFYLQNSALRRVKVAQQTSQRRHQAASEDFSTSLQRSVSARRLSSASELMSSQERIKPPKEQSNSAAARARRLRPSESVASSVASGLHRVGQAPGGAADLGRVLLTDDYFSDVNPRSMRRLMNVLYITGRLLKAFQIDFNWYQLASWVNLTEQWPFRTSWIIYHHETYEEHIDDTTSLKHIYDKIKPSIPILRDAEPLMELDRDERKLEVFLSFHRSTLLAADLKIFLPFTINLDPYIKKVIKEEQQQHGIDEESAQMMYPGQAPHRQPHQHPPTKLFQRKSKPPPLAPLPSAQSAPPVWIGWAPGGGPAYPGAQVNYMGPGGMSYAGGFMQGAPVGYGPAPPPSATGLSSTHSALSTIRNSFQGLGDVGSVRLSKLSVPEVCSLVTEALGQESGDRAATALSQHNVCGMVLSHCDLAELKQVLNLPFGDWEMFKMLTKALRDLELTQPLAAPVVTVIAEESPEDELEPPKQRPVLETQRSRPSNMEKQVTLEEQMICGALQTLNEEALEDVMQTDPPPTQPDEESELRMLAPGAGGAWAGPSPPASPCATPPAPRRPDPSILKPGGSFRSHKKHVSINDGVPVSLKYDRRTGDVSNVTFKFENETETEEQITLNIDRRGCNRGAPAVAYNKSDTFNKKAPLNMHAPSNSSMYEQNSKHDKLWRQGSASKLYELNNEYESDKGKPPLPRQNTESALTPRRKSTNQPRPSSLLVTRDDLNEESLSTRSRSVEDSTETDSSIVSTTLKNIKKSAEILKKVSSSEKLSRLKEKLLSKTSHSRERSPAPAPAAAAGDALESDDESTPLVSSELSSPSISSKVNSNKGKSTCSRHSSTSSSSTMSPVASKTHSKSLTNSPLKKTRKKSFGLECREYSFPDITVSTDFTPSSDASQFDSPTDKLMTFDVMPNDKSVRDNTADDVNEERATRTDSEGSLSNMLEPYNLALLSGGASDVSLRSGLWRQDAVESIDWDEPESTV